MFAFIANLCFKRKSQNQSQVRKPNEAKYKSPQKLSKEAKKARGVKRAIKETQTKTQPHKKE